MGNEPGPHETTGTTRPESAHVAAAIAHGADGADRGDRVMRSVSRELERGRARGLAGDSTSDRGFAEGSRLADAAAWAIAKAGEALRAVARELRVQATAALGRPIRNDPVRSVLIAAGVGAVLMALLSRSAKSGARAVERRVRG